jgi:radical SAM protein with 4Fe4S-binding SPASM domain
LTSKEQIDSFLIKTKHLPILSLDIVLSNPIKNILKINDNRILQFTIFNSKVNVKKNIQNKFILTRTNRNFKEEDETCKINLMDLKVNSLLFHESLAFNNYFNKKVVINEVGEIKNYYNQKSSFGNILNDNLKDVLQSSKFKKLWYVSKDQIIQCKNCEFKYSCVDDRIPKYKNKYYDFETPCNYDPFTLVWKKQ